MLEVTEQKSAQQNSQTSQEKKKSRKKRNKDKFLDAESDMATIRERSGLDSIRVSRAKTCEH